MLLHGHAAALFLGPYKLLDRIGRASLAVVYRAVGPTGEVVALKVLPPSRATGSSAACAIPLLGALILLFAQSAGWMLAYLLFL